ncbi:DUF2255 family protein [Microbacterium sp. CFBP9034]|uniref:DUF2255 family protein n=1 Tax=Microbacterium sp. CFBP9034 TaxID=3096540 RepID=UPI002A698DBF|nr:DUF2255 family protein [Microbacterium sp. CFBP9034]MDY0908785.1 DUF2255 family protein [Microbacterium sp. CFBP9034]
MSDARPVAVGAAPSWSPEQLSTLFEAIEIEVSAPRRDGGHGRWTPIWVVVAEADVFVRTWHRRETGWYGGAVRSGVARLRVGHATVDVMVAAVGNTDAAIVDAAYRRKYGDLAARSMVTAEAAASTLRLTPTG